MDEEEVAVKLTTSASATGLVQALRGAVGAGGGGVVGAGGGTGALDSVRGYLLLAAELLVQFSLYLWESSTANNVKTVLIYMPTMMFIYNTMRKLYSSCREKRKNKQKQIEQLQEELSLLEAQLLRHRAGCLEKSKELKLRMERFIRLRERVRELIAGDHSIRLCLKDIAIWEDVTISGGGGDDSNTVAELLHKLNYAERIVPDKTKETERACDERDTFLSTSSRSSGDARAANPRTAAADRVRLVKVTNVYKLAGLRQPSKMAKMKRIELRSLLKKKTENIKKLLQDWHDSLNSVIDKKLSQHNLIPRSKLEVFAASADCYLYNQTIAQQTLLPSSDLGMATMEADDDYECSLQQDELEVSSENDTLSKNPPAKGATGDYDIYQKMNYHGNSSESDQDDVDYYGPSWDYPYQRCERADPVTMLEFNLQACSPPQCECSGPQGSKVLFMLPEETTSQIEISEIEERLEHSIVNNEKSD